MYMHSENSSVLNDKWLQMLVLYVHILFNGYNDNFLILSISILVYARCFLKDIPSWYVSVLSQNILPILIQITINSVWSGGLVNVNMTIQYMPCVPDYLTVAWKSANGTGFSCLQYLKG